MSTTDRRRAEELRVRAALGIPEGARTVLVLGETSHWDPNWLFTADEYFDRRIERILDEVVDELTHDPRRVYAIESLYFFERYWEARPALQPVLRALVEAGRLRFTGTGVTTPDTLLPSTEAILRDYLHGQEWLRHRGMHVEPRLAYLPDDFGHSPALPAILAALGFEHACVTRIDGMHFVGSDYRAASSYPLPGSSAYRLSRELRTQDFVWRAPDGSEVLCHWNAFTYFQGDMLAHLGIIRWMGVTFGVPWRTGRHIARRIASLVRQLAPLAPTPYLFCPIGCDFNGPIPRLLELLDRHNDQHFESTGVWVVNGGMDDYMTLVDGHRDALPVLELDPNPYWMGFYASRPSAKRLVGRTTRKLVLAEKLAFASATCPPAAELERAWELVVLSNHHDFITGTSPERVYRLEQLPWLEEAEAHADRMLARLVPEPAASAPIDAEPPRWRLRDGRLSVETPFYRLALDERLGGCLESLALDGVELLRGPGNDLVVYRDSGGLWRMGHELRGGIFRELERASDRPARIRVEELGATLAVTVECELGGRLVVRRLWLSSASPRLRMRIEGAAARKRTLTCRFPLRSGARSLTMNVPGGVIEREHRKLHRPTFWPARSFAHVVDDAGWGLASFLGGPACVGLTEPGRFEWVALRNAPMELAFGFVPVPAHPAAGREDGPTTLDYAVWPTREGDYRANALPRKVRHALREALFAQGAPDLDLLANRAAGTDHDDVLVTAIKPASRGEGFIARLRSHAEGPVMVRLSTARPLERAVLCDARERDRCELRVEDGAAQVPVERAITSVRLLYARDTG